MVLSIQNYTASTDTEADSWFAQLDASLAAFRAGTAPDWFDERMVDPLAVSMDHQRTHANGYVYCRTEISIPDPTP